ncbi:MAG: hypothetical protein PGN34_10960 [Methylobacterium frigidaeris]
MAAGPKAPRTSETPRTWRTALRLVLTVGPPLVGLFLIGQAVVASIGGDIRKGQFALGVLCLVLGTAGRLVRGR